MTFYMTSYTWTTLFARDSLVSTVTLASKAIEQVVTFAAIFTWIVAALVDF